MVPGTGPPPLDAATLIPGGVGTVVPLWQKRKLKLSEGKGLAPGQTAGGMGHRTEPGQVFSPNPRTCCLTSTLSLWLGPKQRDSCH